jgi:hypothetical protein
MIPLRNFINKPGAIFDALKTTVIFAEDLADIDTNFDTISSALAILTATASETPTGLVNGINTDYVVTNSIHTIFSFAINGQFIHPVDYTVIDKTISFVTPLSADLSGLSFTIVYN